MSNRIPSYRLHKQSGQAVVTLTDPMRGRRDVLLGKHGTKESRAQYVRVLAEWEANSRRIFEKAAASADLTVNELAAAFWKHAEQHYRRPDGTTTSELKEYRRALRPLKHLHGHTLARDFGPLGLKAIRQLMVDGYEHPKYGPEGSLARGVVNQRIGRIRRVFKWAVENELVAPAVFHGLQAVRGLQRGRTAARETEPVKPVGVDLVEQTLPHLNRHVAAMVRVQLLTGARPGEVCVLRSCDLDMSGAVWLYRPQLHKTAHHGHQRVIAVGPKAQEVLRPFLTLDTQAYLFSPRRALEEINSRRRQERKTPMTPSQKARQRKRNPRKAPGERYHTSSFAHAIATACRRAFSPPGDLAHREDESRKEWQTRLTPEQHAEVRRWHKEHHWHPHQLRHTRATELRREFGIDVARAVLGHRSPAITETYAELDAGKAAEVMGRLG